MIFEGKHDFEGRPFVLCDGKALPTRDDLPTFYPGGYAWGCEGSGPAQLALALLVAVFDDTFALEHYEKFKGDILAGIPQEAGWVMDSRLLESWAVENELLERPLVDMAEIVKTVWSARSALCRAGEDLAAHIELEGSGPKSPLARHFATLVVVNSRLERLAEELVGNAEVLELNE